MNIIIIKKLLQNEKFNDL